MILTISGNLLGLVQKPMLAFYHQKRKNPHHSRSFVNQNVALSVNTGSVQARVAWFEDTFSKYLFTMYLGTLSIWDTNGGVVHSNHWKGNAIHKPFYSEPGLISLVKELIPAKGSQCLCRATNEFIKHHTIYRKSLNASKDGAHFFLVSI